MLHSALGWLDTLVPKDRGSRQIASAISFGPDPQHLLDLYAPLRPRGPLPLMVFSYGGGWNSGTRTEYHFAGRALAALGLLVAVADYRVHPAVHFPAFVEDVARAAEWLRGHAGDHGGDPSQIFLSGHSSGAYNAVMAGLQPARFGAPSLAGRISGLIGLSGPYDFFPFDVRESIDAFGGTPHPELTQPVKVATTAAPPTLLIHGQRDRTVGPYNTVHLAQKLRAAGADVVERHYPRLGHPETVLALTRPLRAIWPVYRDIARFVGSHIDTRGR
jgi:acetyl esterase/lipase